MSHPPIAPKSMLEDCGGAGIQIHNGHSMTWLDSFNDFDKPIIAAVAEVEWRKRAERWAKVRDRLVGTAKCKLKICASNAEWDCQFNAAAWRAWGEQK